jgi:hypothetical protein
VVDTIVNIGFATRSRVSWQTDTAETAFLHHVACSVVAAWISVTSVNHRLAMLAVIARRTYTLVLPLRQCPTLGVIFARERVAGVALGQNIHANITAAHELIGRC